MYSKSKNGCLPSWLVTTKGVAVANSFMSPWLSVVAAAGKLSSAPGIEGGVREDRRVDRADEPPDGGLVRALPVHHADVLVAERAHGREHLLAVVAVRDPSGVFMHGLPAMTPTGSDDEMTEPTRSVDCSICACWPFWSVNFTVVFAAALGIPPPP